MMVPPLQHCGTTYDVLLPLLRIAGTTVTSRRYRCYDILVPLLRHAGTTDTAYWNHHYDTLVLYHCYDRQYALSKRRWLFASRHGVTSQKNSTSSSSVQMRRRTHTHTHTHMHTRASSRSILQRSTSYRMLQGTVTDRTPAAYTNLSLRLAQQWSLQKRGTCRRSFICNEILCVDCSVVRT